jgi:glucokinase
MLIDILNPQMIVIGSIYGRQHQILEPVVLETIRQEALAISAAVCKVVPAGLGEQVGDYASLSVALNTHHERESYPQPEVS